MHKVLRSEEGWSVSCMGKMQLIVSCILSCVTTEAANSSRQIMDLPVPCFADRDTNVWLTVPERSKDDYSHVSDVMTKQTAFAMAACMCGTLPDVHW